MLDFFAGSNTTGAVAEAEGRRWLAFEERLDYLATSVLRFLGKDCRPEDMRRSHDLVMSGETFRVLDYVRQAELPGIKTHVRSSGVPTSA